jgi:glycosyltransferase involved in cell wall biosynthesis
MTGDGTALPDADASRRLRIAYVVAALRPGGAERQMLTLAERLPKDLFHVSFLVLSGPAEYDERGASAGATIRHVGAAPAADAFGPSKVLRRLRKTATFVKTAREGRYDIIDAWLYPFDVLAAVSRPFTRVPVVISGRRNLDPHESFGRAGGIVDSIADRMTDMVVANSTAAADYALAHERLDPAKVRIIRNGVELPSPERVDRGIRQELGFEDDQLVIGCVANYLPVKRHDLLIEAFASVVKSFPNARLALVGDGPMRPAMEARIMAEGLDKRTRLVGSVADAPSIIGAFDIAVQASRSEGLPNALLEAAAAGLPIVATAAGGTSEIVRDGDTGLLVPIEDPAALASALLRALTDAELRRRLGGSARARVATVFAMDRFVSEFADLYRELARGRGTPRTRLR